jgi:FixJ family two-component response regulator
MTSAGKILLADDEAMFRTSTAELLRSDGFGCDCAESGSQAIELLRRNRYDVLIADICMEGNSDLALVRDTSQIAPGLPVILVTGHPSLETAIPSIHLAVMAYLRKPVEYEKIREQVRRASEHSALHRTMIDIHQRLAGVATEFAAINDRISPHSDPSELIPISLVRDVSTALTDILRLRASLGCQDSNQSLCKLLDCTIHPNYNDAIAETIEILKRTKNSFKSKELASLRLRLESILEKPHFLPRPHISCATISQRQS